MRVGNWTCRRIGSHVWRFVYDCRYEHWVCLRCGKETP